MKVEINRNKNGTIKQEFTRPGKVAHTHQYVLNPKGKLVHTKRKEKEKDMYMGGTIFVDNAPRYIYSKSDQQQHNHNA